MFFKSIAVLCSFSLSYYIPLDEDVCHNVFILSTVD